MTDPLPTEALSSDALSTEALSTEALSTAAPSTGALSIEALGLRKSYGGNAVLDGVDLRVPTGTIHALLGPNGAGKTTVVRILSTLVRADAGTLRVGGHDVARDPDAVRRVIGVTGQFSAVDNLLTGRENLALMADLHHLGRAEGRRRADGLLERFELTGDADRTPATYSGGMRRKLDLAMTLVGRPRVIFLDEPTTGLDPRTRRVMWDAVRALAADGVTILLTTQYLEEADQLARRMTLLDHGGVVAEGTAAELKRRVPGGHILLRLTDPAGLDAAERVFPGSTRDGEDLGLRVPSDGDVRTLRAVLNTLDHDRIGVDGLTVHTPDLDDVFLALTGRPTLEAP